MKTRSLHWASLSVLYVLVFFMLYEWLVPISELTGTGNLPLIVMFVVICFMTNIVTIWPAWCNILLKVGFIAFFIFYVYGHLMPSEIATIFGEFISSAKAIVTLDFEHIANSVRTFIFLVLLWMTVYLIHHWLTVRYSIFLFFFMTVFFLASIDTFTEYDATYPLVRVMCIGFFLAGLLFIEKIFANHHVQPTLLRYVKLTVPLLIMILISSVFAYTMPKQQAAMDLPAPIAAINDFITKQLSPPGKIGYVEDDSNLGGSFEEDDTPVLDMWAAKNQYLRVDTKSIYTGTGWERKSGDIYVRTFDYGERIPLSIEGGQPEHNDTMTVEMRKQYEFIVQPYGLKKVIEDTAATNRFYVELDTEKIRPVVDEQRVTLNDYELRYSEPVYQLSKLKKTSMKSLKTLSDDYEPYLQLPKQLPTRIKTLTDEIVKDEKSVYDKATAIEAYFSYNGFRYSRDEVGYPKEGQDYVDHFLFDTKVGYCDNFSTAMVVMLRTQGIPARWVKGFAEGDEVEQTKNRVHVEVTNNNAHSWVEAYMPGVGWVQFEPTIGFEGFEQVVDDTKPEQDATADEQTPEVESDDTTSEAKQQETPKEEDPEQQQSPTTTIAAPNWWPWMIGAIILIVGFIIWMSRKKWLPRLVTSRYEKKTDVSIEAAYEDLLKILAMNGLKRKKSETLQQFANRVDNQLGGAHMTHFMSEYERYLYDPTTNYVDWGKLKESWQYLINTVRG